MKILIVDEFADIGGAQRIILNLLRERCSDLNESHDYHLVLPGRGPFSEAAAPLVSGINFIDIMSFKLSWLNPLRHLDITRRFKAVVRNVAPGLILLNSIWALSVLQVPLRLCHIPVVCAVHAGIRPRSEMKRKWFERLGQFLLSRVDHWIVVNDAIADTLTAAGVHPDSVTVISNGIDLNLFKPAEKRGLLSRRYGVPADAFLIGTAGRLHPGKGQDFLVRNLAGVFRQEPETRFFIFGQEVVTPCENLEFTEYLKSLIRESGSGGAVYLTGFIRDMHEVLPDLDLYVSASKEESFGLSVLEALACGVPVVCSDVLGHRRLVSHKSNGLIFPADSGDSFREAVLGLYGDRSRLERLRRRTRDSVRQYDVSVMASNWEKVLRATGDRRRPVP